MPILTIIASPRAVYPTWLLLVRWIFFSSRRRHTRFKCDWSSDVCSSDLGHDFRHAFRGVPAGALVNLLGLSDAEAIPRIPACSIVEYFLPVGCLRPACQRIQQPRAELDRKSVV